MTEFRFFDGHCDTISRCLETGEPLRQNTGHVDLSRTESFAAYAQVFALFCEDTARAPQMLQPLYARYLLETDQPEITRCRTAAEVRAAKTRCCALLSLEGAELLGCDPENLVKAQDYGVRMINITWNHCNALSGAHLEGADCGLSDLGRIFVRDAQMLGILMDVSHLSQRGFWDLVRCTRQPIVASHSNCSAVFPHSRSLTDEQIRAIAETGGVVGLNLYARFLGTEPTFETLLRHLEHLMDIGGEEIAAMGADFDGCDRLCGGFSGIQDVPAFAEFLRTRGYPDALLQRIFFENWLRIL